jgi:hypothetical protein
MAFAAQAVLLLPAKYGIGFGPEVKSEGLPKKSQRSVASFVPLMPQIEPWLTSSCLPRSFTLELCHHPQRKLTRMGQQAEHLQGNERLTKQSGLDLEKHPRSSGRGGAFFLTSLFIELIEGKECGPMIQPQFSRASARPSTNATSNAGECGTMALKTFAKRA